MKVGLIYDPIYLEHDTGSHVENRGRLERIIALLEDSGLMNQLVSLKPRPAEPEEILAVHTRGHLSKIENICKAGGGWLDGDTVTSSESYKVAFYAAGGALRGVDAVLGGEVDKAFALIRPPGHHATPTKAMGFCLFNNIAIAAKYALNKHKLRRILIADFDVHHGNGTQEIFYGDSKVLYFSTHQYPFYPGTGSVNEIGKGLGKGTTVNVPLPAWCGDSEYQRAYEEVLVPIARKFKPDLLLVSAGYDPHWADQISMMQLSVDGFAEIVNILRELADELCHGRAAFLLEGGYHPEALPHSIKASLDVLLENPRTPDPLGPSPQTAQPPSIDSVIEGIKIAHGVLAGK